MLYPVIFIGSSDPKTLTASVDESNLFTETPVDNLNGSMILERRNPRTVVMKLSDIVRNSMFERNCLLGG